MKPINILERFVNGKMIQGLPHDFLLNKGRSHVVMPDHHLADETVELSVDQLKATLNSLGPKALCTGSSPPFRVASREAPVLGYLYFTQEVVD